MKENFETAVASLDWRAPLRLASARLSLQPCCARTAIALAQIMQDVRVAEPFFVGRPQAEMLRPDGAAWLQHEDSWLLRRQCTLVAQLHVSGEVIGCVQFIDGLLAYFIAPRFWRQGLGAEMVQAACLDLPRRLGMKLLETSVVRENLASRRILEKSGFQFAGMELRNRNGVAGKAAMLWYRRRY